jgi:hypothetical protein
LDPPEEGSENVYYSEKPVDKTGEDLYNKSTPIEKTGSGTKQSEIKGDFETAIDDFYSMNPTDVKKYANGTIVGKLPDGRTINVRPNSTYDEGKPTIEISKPNSKKPDVKFRYTPE